MAARVRGRGRAPPQHGLDARHQLHHVERLRQVVVGAQLEAEHAVHHLAARGEHDHRRRDALLAQVAEHVEAVLARQRHVEQHQVEAALARPARPGVAGLGRLHLVALGAQPVAERQHQPRLVLDDQDSAAHEALASGNGSSTTSEAPPPSPTSTCTLPPCACTT